MGVEFEGGGIRGRGLGERGGMGIWWEGDGGLADH